MAFVYVNNSATAAFVFSASLLIRDESIEKIPKYF